MNKESNLAILPQSILNWIDNNSHNFICIWDCNMKLLFITNSVISFLGYKPIELLGENWSKMITKEDQANLCQNLKSVEENKDFHIYLSDYQSNRIQFEARLDKIVDSESDIIYYIASFQSMLNQSQTEEMIVRSEKMSIAGQLAASIAHEIRNPLTSLKGFLQLLQAGVNQKEVYYQIMIEEIEKIEMITSELLFISKPLTDEKKVESVYSMLKDVILLLKSQAHLKDIEIKLSVDKELYTFCNRSQIKQVLINIIKNAIEAMEKIGVIIIEVTSVNEKNIEIDIIDEGPGISEDIIDKIGEPFFTTKQSGTGLGLMITKQILEQQNGKILIAKSNENGSTFRIILPVATESLNPL